MLVISRQPGDSFLIGEDVKVTILEVSGDRIRIGIDAPRSVSIMRSEVVDARKVNQEAVQSGIAPSLQIPLRKLKLGVPAQEEPHPPEEA